MWKYLNVVKERVGLFSCNVFNDIQLLLIKFKINFYIVCSKLTDFSQPDLPHMSYGNTKFVSNIWKHSASCCIKDPHYGRVAYDVSKWGYLFDK